MRTGWGMHKREIDLGLALLGIANQDREGLSCEEIAAWCGCHRSRIEQIEQGALRKLRGALHGKRREWL